MSTLVGIAGRAGSGKSTCAKWLVEQHGFVRISLADPLKKLAMRVFELSEKQVFGSQHDKETVDPRWGQSPRQLLIKLGHEARQALWPDIWLDAALKKTLRPGKYVIDDVRYDNEAQGIVARGGHVIKLECPNAWTRVDPNAPSEKSVDEIPEAFLTAILIAERSNNAELLLRGFQNELVGVGI